MYMFVLQKTEDNREYAVFKQYNLIFPNANQSLLITNVSNKLTYYNTIIATNENQL